MDVVEDIRSRIDALKNDLTLQKSQEPVIETGQDVQSPSQEEAVIPHIEESPEEKPLDEVVSTRVLNCIECTGSGLVQHLGEDRLCSMCFGTGIV